MGLDFTIGEELRRTFHLAALRKEANANLTGRQWEVHRQIKQRSERARQQERKLYRARYMTRVEQRQRKLIDDAGRIRRDLQHPWFPRDRFDKSATFAQAQRDVRADHKRRMARIDNYEERALSELVEKSRTTHRDKGVASKEFQRSTRDQTRPSRPRQRDR